MKQWKGFLAGVLCTLLSAGLIVTAAARTETVWQELTYRDIRVSLNGEVLDLRNAIGEPVEPFMFGGTNYLPVRALAEALGLNVAWDGAEVMVVLTTPEPPASEPEASAEVTPEASAAATVKPETASNEEPEATAETPTPTVTPEPTPEPETPELLTEWGITLSDTVYITPSGKHWHLNGTCNGGTYTPTTLEEALKTKRGGEFLTPCDKCVLKIA